jgi:hypothetical protein
MLPKLCEEREMSGELPGQIKHFQTEQASLLSEVNSLIVRLRSSS